MKPVDLEFKEYSKEEWLVEITKSLKVGSLEDFVWKLDDNVSGYVFAHEEDVKNADSEYNTKRKDNSWLRGLDYSLISSEKVNDFIKLHSSFGLESMVLNIDDSNFDFNTIFNGLDLTKYEIFFNTRYGVDIILLMETFNDYLKEKDIDTKGLEIAIRLPFDNPEEMLELYNFLQLNFPKIKYLYRSEKELSYNPAKYLTETFKDISDFIKLSEIDETMMKDILSKLYFHFFLTENFLTDIVFLRAFKLLWKNYNKVLNIENVDDKIIVGINHDAFTEDENQDLIISTIVSMASGIAGVRSINIAPKENGISNHQDFMRLVLNIQNIMIFESNINLVKHSMAGSFAIESATRKLAESVWKRM
ncbi:MAG: methylmalonyl-CoA mutase family protein [Saprospiraceae bacterium]